MSNLTSAWLDEGLASGRLKLDKSEALTGRSAPLHGPAGKDEAHPEAASHGPAPPHEAKSEAKLQAEVEGLLHMLGYWRRSKDWIRAGERPPCGWQYHLSPKGARLNPMLLDVLLLGNDGRYVEFELKVTGGRWTSEEQRVLCEDHGARKFENAADAVAYVKEWENARVTNSHGSV